MSADIINLNQYRKSKAKAERKVTASENRRKHGRTRAEKLSDKVDSKKAKKQLDGKKLDEDHEKPA